MIRTIALGMVVVCTVIIGLCASLIVFSVNRPPTIMADAAPTIVKIQPGSVSQ
jgi:hypothetical protein